MRIAKLSLPVLALLAGLGQANAQIVTWTYAGNIDSDSGSVDNLGYWGGGDLSGDAFSIIITADSSKGTLIDGGNANFTLQGGSRSDVGPTATIPLSASVTINGITHTNFSSLAFTDVSEIAQTSSGQTFLSQVVDTDSCNACGTGSNIGIQISDAWDSIITLAPDGGPSSLPDLGISGFIYGLNQSCDITAPCTGITFSDATLTVSLSSTPPGGGGSNPGDGGDNPGGAPEPGTWAMLLAGFALMGSMVRYAGSKALTANRA